MDQASDSRRLLLDAADRLLILDADAMGRLRKELVWTLGEQRARAVLTRFGYALGYSAAVKRRDTAEDDATWLGGAAEALRDRGLARLAPEAVTIDRARVHLDYRARLDDSFEVRVHASHLGREGTNSACWTLVGFLSGYLSAFLGDEVYFAEAECAIAGGSACRVVGLPVAAWGSEKASELQRLFAEENVGTELTVVYDELARKNSEMERANAMLHAQQEATPDAILIVSRERRILASNRRLLELWGIPADLAASGDGPALVDHLAEQVSDPSRFRALIDETHESPDAARDGDIVELRDGRVLSRTTFPVTLGNGIVVARAWYFRDITVARRIDEELRRAQRLDAVGTLAGGIAHDFNNLLMVIGGNITLAESAPQDEVRRSALRSAMTAVERAAGLTRALLSFSRRGTARRQHLDLGAQVTAVVEMLRRTIHPHIAIEVWIAPDLWTVEADPSGIDQVLTNLVVNARDAMSGGGRLRIDLRNRDLSNGDQLRRGIEIAGAFVSLTVADTGCGISHEVQARMYEPFFTTKEVGKGTGLGLAVVYGIVEQHQGIIHCRSTPDHGATFEVLLPRVDRPATAEPAEPAAESGGTCETVLLVDDDPQVRDIVRQILERGGHAVITAGDGIEAMQAHARARDRIQVVVLDLLMPRRAGPETLADLRAVDPDLPVIITSGHHDEAARLADGQHATSRLDKPYRSRDLLQAVARALEQRRVLESV